MAFRASKRHLVVAILLISFLIDGLGVATAASGGVMGGSSFSSDQEDRSLHEDRSYYSSSSYYDSSSDTPPASSGDAGWGFVFFLTLFFLGVAALFVFDFYWPRGNNILMLQVALLGEARTLMKDLDQVAYTASTTTLKGFHYVLTESSLALLQHQNHCISGYSRVEQKLDIANLEKRFNYLSLEERGKFDIETLMNVNNVKVQRNCIRKANKLSREYIVVTILVAAQGRHELPDIKDGESLKVALQCLASISISSIKAVQVLWTPQNENDALFEDELLENYPHLRPISHSEDG